MRRVALLVATITPSLSKTIGSDIVDAHTKSMNTIALASIDEIISKVVCKNISP